MLSCSSYLVHLPLKKLVLTYTKNKKKRSVLTKLFAVRVLSFNPPFSTDMEASYLTVT